MSLCIKEKAPLISIKSPVSVNVRSYNAVFCNYVRFPKQVYKKEKFSWIILQFSAWIAMKIILGFKLSLPSYCLLYFQE